MTREKNQRDSNRKKSNYPYLQISYLKDPKNSKKSLRSYKHIQQSSKIQNQYTKTVAFLYTKNEIYQENNTMYNSIKRSNT
jgi:hypothetical protein